MTRGEKVVFWVMSVLMAALAVLIARSVDVDKGWQSAMAVTGLFLMVSLVPAGASRTWKWLRKPRGRTPDGTPGIRDVDHPCDMFEYGKADLLNDCQGDGHYLCDECCHRKILDEICRDCIHSYPDDCYAEHIPDAGGKCEAYEEDQRCL